MVRSFAGTFGVLSLDEDNLNRVKINDLRFMLSISASSNSNVDNSTNVFAYTFMNRLLISFQFSYPKLGSDWGEMYADNFYDILKCFAEQSDQHLTLKSVIDRLKRFDDKYQI